MSKNIITCKFCGKVSEYDPDFSDPQEFCNYRCKEYYNLKLVFENGCKDEGFMPERVFHNNWERTFMEHWKKENKVRPGINYGHGTLQDLFMRKKKNCVMDSAEILIFIEPRDRFVAATVIQWLGTNCGNAFLDGCLRDTGRIITRMEGYRDEFQKLSDLNPPAIKEICYEDQSFLLHDYHPKYATRDEKLRINAIYIKAGAHIVPWPDEK